MGCRHNQCVRYLGPHTNAMLFSSILLMIPQILSHKTSKFDESSLSTDMDNLYSNVKDIAVHDTYNINSIDESSVNRDNMPSDTSKFEELVSKAINNATDDIHDTIVNEHKNMEINDSKTNSLYRNICRYFGSFKKVLVCVSLI